MAIAEYKGMEATFKYKNHIVLAGDGSFLLHASAEKSWKFLEKSGNLIPEIRWEPCFFSCKVHVWSTNLLYVGGENKKKAELSVFFLV